ncbi:MAG: TldD/PmbA family protein [Candidatus Cryptobacteroides sp.]
MQPFRNNRMAGIITEHEMEMARYCVARARELGAEASRVSLSKNVLDSVTFFNGEFDKVTHSSDRSVYLYLYVDGRYGTFSTNRLDRDELSAFVRKAVDTVRMLEKDECRRLPDERRTVKDAVSGIETGIYDESYFDEDMDSRIAKARGMSIFHSLDGDGRFTPISEECEYSDSVDDSWLIDSQGLEARHIETSAGCFCEMNISDPDGNKYSGYWWDSSFSSRGIDMEGCARKALEKVLGQLGPKPSRGGRHRMVVDSTVASRLVSPLISALNMNALQQKMSFLGDSLGKKVFPDNLTIMDMARERGKLGARYFDSEGVATANVPIVENGVVKIYFTDTYMSAKTGAEPNVEDVSRPCLKPWLNGCADASGIGLDRILKHCRNGIYVTGFNGGNCNPVTGDYSFGIEGFKFSRGRIVHPVKEMLITGNLLELWNSLEAVGSDARPCTRWQIPTLAFDGVSFSA